MARKQLQGKDHVVTEADRQKVLELARKYLHDDQNVAIQRWAFKEVLPYVLPRLSSQEFKQDGAEGFKIVVEDYRTKEKESMLAPIVLGRSAEEDEVAVEDALQALEDLVPEGEDEH